MSETIGFIGLGRLGLPVATNLLTAGYQLRVYNRTPGKAETLVARGAQLASRPADVATPGGVVITLVWDDAVVESIVASDNFLEQLGPGGLHIAMSTVLPATSKKLATLHAQHGSTYIDAPIFGRPEAADSHSLWIPVSGPQAARERALPILKALGGQGIFDFGEEVGAANIVKLVGNFLISSAGYSLHEALTAAQKNGVDPRPIVAMLTQTLFNAPIYKSHGQRIAEGDMAFGQSPIPLKDVGLLQTTAQQVGSPTPIASTLLELMQNNR